MAQKIFFNYQQALTSFDVGQQFNGILWPGRYCGFDTKAFSGMTLSLTHAASGIIQTNAAGSQTTATGILMSRQGSVIQEDATVSIGTVSANSSGNPRIDLVVGQYLKPSAAVTSATYLIVTGTASSIPIAPSLPNPEKQVTLGQLLVPNGTITDLSSCTYIPATIPLLGNEARPTALVYTTPYTLTTQTHWFADTGNGTAQTTTLNISKTILGRTSISFLNDLWNTDNSTETIGTLPVGIRPSQTLMIPVIASTDTYSSPSQAILKITPAGVMTAITTFTISEARVLVRGLIINLD